eukprot:11127032-Lingulodinium_polyedra.AAC.1
MPQQIAVLWPWSNGDGLAIRWPLIGDWFRANGRGRAAIDPPVVHRLTMGELPLIGRCGICLFCAFGHRLVMRWPLIARGQ